MLCLIRLIFGRIECDFHLIIVVTLISMINAFLRLFTDHMHVFFPVGRQLASTDKPTLACLANDSYILIAPETSVRKTLQHALEAENLSCPLICCHRLYQHGLPSLSLMRIGASRLPRAPQALSAHGSRLPAPRP